MTAYWFLLSRMTFILEKMEISSSSYYKVDVDKFSTQWSMGHCGDAFTKYLMKLKLAESDEKFCIGVFYFLQN